MKIVQQIHVVRCLMVAMLTVAVSALCAAQQAQRVVIEEATGDWCGACPDGARTLQGLQKRYGSDVIVLSYHGPANEPLAIPNGIALLKRFGTTAYPSAVVQRRPVSDSGSIMTFEYTWEQQIRNILDADVPAPVHLRVEGYAFDEENNIVTATVVMTTAVAVELNDATLRLTAIVKQDSIKLTQTEYTLDGKTVHHENYLQMNVVRAVWPGDDGLMVEIPETARRDGSIVAGSELRSEIRFAVESPSTAADLAFNAGHSRLVLLVHRESEIGVGPILQALEMPLIQRLSNVAERSTRAAGALRLTTAVPNPTDGPVRLVYSLPTPCAPILTIFHVTGRRVMRIEAGDQASGDHAIDADLSELPGGLYLATLNAGGQAATARIIVVGR